MSGLVTRQYRIHLAEQLVESFTEASPTRFYYFIGKNYPYANTVQLTGTVKTTTSSNTIVGQGTVFTTQLAVGDIVAMTGQANTVRVHSISSAQTFITALRPTTSITTGANAYIRKQFSESNPPTQTDNYQDVYYDVWRNMIAVKRVQSSDITLAALRNDWANNTAYVQYTDTNASLNTQDFFVMTDSYNVYKCLDNNRDANSVVKPTGTSTAILSTADGYRWKYMYTITTAEASKFLTSARIPVKTLTANDGSAQWAVQQAASNGVINHIAVVANGANYLHLSNTFGSVTNGSSMTLAGGSSAVDDIYNYSAVYISSGLGSGQIRKIINYVGSSKTITVNNAFAVTPNTSSGYIVSPLVSVRGDSGGTTTSRATAYVANTFGGQVRKITIINPGRSYSTANIAITANSSHGSGATGTVIISPQGGHGSDPADELYGHDAILNIQVSGSESNTFPTNNDFRVIGILRDPRLANNGIANTSVIDQTTRVTVAQVTGDFTADEVVTGATNGARARLLYFANTNAARTSGVLKFVNIATNGIGIGFTAGETVTGATSGITANVQSVTAPALKKYSGLVMYVENRIPITRASDQIEDVKISIVL